MAQAQIQVLHADDDANFSDLSATFLEREDNRFCVETATSAEDGLRAIDATPPDCVVSDYNMPGMDGIEFLQTVRADHPDLPFILYTGKGSEEVAADAISAGVTEYLQKESGTEQYRILANRIKNAVSARRSSIEAEQSRHRLERTVKTVPSCVVRLDYEGRFVFANDRAVEVLGLEESELTDRGYNDPEWEITDLNGEPIPDEKLPFRQVRDSGEPLYGFRHTVRWPDGTQKILLVNGAPLVGADGEISGVVFSLTDITARVEDENRLTQAGARLDALFESTPDMINIHDAEGNIIDPNPILCEETGYEEDELTAMKVWELDRDINAEEAETLWEEMEPGDRERLEGLYQRRDGSEFPVEVHIRRLNVDGKNRFIAISRDITEQRERKQDLEQYREIVESMDDIATIIKPDGTMTYVSPVVEQMLGYKPEELIGENGFSYQPPETSETVGEAIERVITTPDEPQTVQTQFRRADGSLCWVESTLRNRLERKMIDGILVTSRDVTERVHRRQELQRQNERLEEFAGLVSHDLRNPLSAAEGRLEMAQQDCESRHLSAISQAHDRMDALISDILRLAREKDTVAEKLSVDLGKVIEECWAGVEATNASLVADSNQTVEADEGRLKQIFENLFRNSVDHGGEDITISVGELDDGFYVEDDGPGIPEEDREDVFEAGYSTSETRTGFGLSIVEEVVKAHNWDITVTASEDGGARFEVTGLEGSDR